MARLPQVGGDVGNWGTLLNDFLAVGHNADGAHKNQAYKDVLSAPGVTGNGEADDTAGISAVLASSRSGEAVLFRAPPVAYKITGPLTVPSGVRVLGVNRNVEIRQATWGKAIFDCIDADNVTVENFYLNYIGTARAMNLLPSFRGDSGYAYSAGVWANGSGVHVKNVKVNRFAMGVYFSSYSSRTNAFAQDGHSSNGVWGLETNNVDHSVLWVAQKDLRVHNVYAYNQLDSSAGINPNHTIYGSGGPTLLSTNVIISNCFSDNNSTGAAYQLKYVRGGMVSNLYAKDCMGIMALLNVHDLTVSNMFITNSGNGIGSGSLSLQDVDERDVKIDNLTIYMKPNGGRAIGLRGTRIVLTNCRVFVNYSSAKHDYDVSVRGTDIDIDGISIIGLGPARGRAIGFQSGSGLKISNIRTKNVITTVDIAAGTTGCVVAFDPAFCDFENTSGFSYVMNNGGAIVHRYE